MIKKFAFQQQKLKIFFYNDKYAKYEKYNILRPTPRRKNHIKASSRRQNFAKNIIKSFAENFPKSKALTNLEKSVTKICWIIYLFLRSFTLKSAARLLIEKIDTHTYNEL